MKLRVKTEPLALIASDLHLDDRQWGKVYDDSKFAFRQVLDLTINNRVPLVLCGDVIDVKQPSIETLSFMRKQIDRFDRKAEASDVIYYIQGQHEYSEPTWLSLLEPRYNPPYEKYELLKHVHGKQFQLGKYKCYAIDWTPADKLADALKAIPDGIDYLFCHQVWDQFMGSLTSPEGSLENVNVSKAVFTGDYHKHMVKYVTNRGGARIPVYSPGATHMRAINEPSQHFVCLLMSDGRVESLPLKSRLVVRINAKNKAALADLLANCKRYTRSWLKQVTADLPTKLQKPLLEVCVKDYNADISAAFDDKFFLWQKIAKRPETSQKAVKAKAIVDAGAKNCLSMVVPKHQQHYKLLLRLLSASKKDIPKIVKQIRFIYVKDARRKTIKYRVKKLATA